MTDYEDWTNKITQILEECGFENYGDYPDMCSNTFTRYFMRDENEIISITHFPEADEELIVSLKENQI